MSYSRRSTARRRCLGKSGGTWALYSASLPSARNARSKKDICHVHMLISIPPKYSVAEYGWVAGPVKAGLRPPPSAADGLDRTWHPTIVCHQEFDGKERLKCTQVPMLRRPTLDWPLRSDQGGIDRLAPGLGYDSRAERRAKFRCSEWRIRGVRLAALRWCRRSSPIAGSPSRFG